MAAFSLLDLVFAMGLAATLGSMALPQTLSSLDEVRTVAAETAQVYLGAKRAERRAQPRRPIAERALPQP